MNIIPGVESVYTWESKVEIGIEVLMMAKTRQSLLPQLTRCVYMRLFVYLILYVHFYVLNRYIPVFPLHACVNPKFPLDVFIAM